MVVGSAATVPVPTAAAAAAYSAIPAAIFQDKAACKDPAAAPACSATAVRAVELVPAAAAASVVMGGSFVITQASKAARGSCRISG